MEEISDFELYLKYSPSKYYNNPNQFKDRMLSFLKMSQNDLQRRFNSAEQNQDEETLIILLAMMRRKAIAFFNPQAKTECDICFSAHKKIIILKNCLHGYCIDCLKSKVKSISNNFSYKVYFENQKKCKCDKCGIFIPISNIDNLGIFKDDKNILGDNSTFCDICNEEDVFYEMRKCYYRICKKKLKLFLEKEFNDSIQSKSLDNMKCPNQKCNENISYFLSEFIDFDKILKNFPNFLDENY